MSVHSVKNLWRGTYLVTYSRQGRHRRHQACFRRIDGDWFSGVENPTGVYSDPLRQAHPAIAAALNAVTP
jgi:hypothetical protein